MTTGTGAGETHAIDGGEFSGPVYQGRDITVFEAAGRVPGPAPPAPVQLPPPEVGFVGRDAEIGDLLGLLDPAGGTAAVMPLVVAGPAGVGKTALVVQTGHEAARRGWFPGGVLFIELDGYKQVPVEPAQALDALLRSLGVAAADIPLSTGERAARFRSTLARIGEPVLLIVDDALSEAQVRPLLPGTARHRVVITSRPTLAGLGARIFQVEALDEVGGVALLDKALRAARPDDGRIGADPDGAARLARMCDGLPLALSVAAVQLKADPRLTIGELSADLARQGQLQRLRYDDGSGAGSPSVEAAFELSYQRLDETSARVFRALSVSPGPDFSTAAAAAVTGLPPPEARRVLGGLAGAHLLEATPENRWRLSDLLSLFAQRLAEASADADGRERARDRLLGYYLAQVRAAVGPPEDARDVFPDPASALAWLDAERPTLVAASRMAAAAGRLRVAMELPLLLAGYLSIRQHFDDWLATAAICLDAARQLAHRHDVGAALNNLGLAMRKAGESAAAVATLTEAANTFGQIRDRAGRARALTNQGLALREAGQPAEAIPALNEAVGIFREARDRGSEGAALGILGGVLRDADRPQEAATLLRRAAEIFREAHYPSGEARVLRELGDSLRETGQPEQAATVYAQAESLLHTADDQRAGSPG